ncbi:hypothetical protein E2C01_011573 [Portunus trituberculatus]|uniref:Uncharacterized protein n=1 Tax=Portunus trituberculatus TaxID=210409 RepID=A0A5B7DBK5_PORTR|nr:hypothetical protein [Portunus trituberculatus]
MYYTTSPNIHTTPVTQPTPNTTSTPTDGQTVRPCQAAWTCEALLATLRPWRQVWQAGCHSTPGPPRTPRTNPQPCAVSCFPMTAAAGCGSTVTCDTAHTTACCSLEEHIRNAR